MSLKTSATFVDSKKVRDLFEKYDLDKNGVLDKEEFIKIMVNILKQLSEDLPDRKHLEIAEEAFTKFDMNQDKVIEFNEFYELMRFIISEKGYEL